MITALFVINAELAVGFVGDSQPIATFSLSPDLQSDVRQAVAALLTAPKALRVVIVEPPLFATETKHRLAELLLVHHRIQAVGFFPASVACVAGRSASEGIVEDAFTDLAVPVFDFRELTPLVVALEERDELTRRLPLDLRRLPRVPMDWDAVWLGASALASQRQVWPMLTRAKFQERGVWDSLYDVR